MKGHNYGLCRKCNRVHSPTYAGLGKAPWHKGLTKETDERVAKMGRSISLANKGWIFTTEHRLNISKGLKGKPHTEERKLNTSKALKGRFSWSKGLTKETDERVEKQAKKLRGRTKENDLGRAKASKKLKGKPTWIKGLTKETDPRLVEAAKKSSNRQKEHWQDPIYKDRRIKEMTSGRHIKPNKAETALGKIIDDICPNEYEYVGDWKTSEAIIGSKCPDFWNRDHKLIELFGNYWHRNDNPEDKINHYKEYGYDCLVIWESELNKVSEVREKIRAFNCTSSSSRTTLLKEAG